MGQQQLLLVILGVILVAFAIAFGLSMFSTRSLQATKEALVTDMNVIADDAYQYRIRTTSMGGGNQSYKVSDSQKYTIPSKLTSNENGSYTITEITANRIAIKATSASNPNNYITAVIDSVGNLTEWSYGGEFQ